MKLAACLAGCALPLLGSERCLVVDASRILVEHVAAAVPALAALPPELQLGYAPAPGLVRWWKGPHVRAIALRHGVETGVIEDFCVERPAAAVRENEVRETLAALLPAGARLEVVDYCRLPVPRGELQFSLRGLGRPPNPQPVSLLMWRGRMIYDKNRSAPFWATVRISVHHEGFYAARELPQGQVVSAEDLRAESREESVFSTAPEAQPGRLVGRRSRRSIAAGTALTGDLLVAPREVDPGENIEVQVQSGTARLRLDAQAVTGGRSGDQVLLLNRATGKRFQATVEGKSRAVVDLEVPHEKSHQSGAGVQPAAGAGSGGRRPGSPGQGQAGARPDESARPGDSGR